MKEIKNMNKKTIEKEKFDSVEEERKHKDNMLFVLCFWDRPWVKDEMDKLHYFIKNYFLEKNPKKEDLIEIMVKRITKSELKKYISDEEYKNISHLFKEKLEPKIPNPLNFVTKIIKKN